MKLLSGASDVRLNVRGGLKKTHYPAPEGLLGPSGDEAEVVLTSIDGNIRESDGA